MSDKVILGKFGAAYGVRGWLHLISYTDPPKNILNYSKWRVNHGGQWLTVVVEDGKAHNKGLIVKIKGLDDRELAREYTNDTIAIDQHQLTKTAAKEFYWRDLVGAEVMTKTGTVLGIVKELIATGSNDVFVVSGERERLIPYTDDAVIEINIAHRRIIVDWDPEF